MNSMTLETAALCFAELGHPTRLAIYRRLVQGGDGGIPVGVIGEELGVVPSTLSHHIKQLVTAGLVEQVRDGRTLYCRPVYPRMDALLGFLTEQCCQRPADGSAPEAVKGCR
ncbi:MAG TPA: helix-turn-helix transcriptional regulator [Azospirillaceae bacterium]|nr:helix-turn-helix transcriptional regulator [Azospirillaceae bacterium]